MPLISWKKDGKELTPSDRVSHFPVWLINRGLVKSLLFFTTLFNASLSRRNQLHYIIVLFVLAQLLILPHPLVCGDLLQICKYQIVKTIKRTIGYIPT